MRQLLKGTFFDSLKNSFGRPFDENYFLDHGHFHQYSKMGFCVVEKALSPDEIRHSNDFFDSLEDYDEYRDVDSFNSTGRTLQTNIIHYVQSEMKRLSMQVLPRFLDVNTCRVDTGGAMHIKAASDTSIVHPHQDSPVVDERRDYIVQAWIPLSDVTTETGCMHVLPHSHLWGNFQRSLNVDWPFASCTRTLWKHMIPIPLKAGDALCFDPALIHGSRPNTGRAKRFAMTLVGVPNDISPVHYYRDKGTPKGMVEVYQTDREFWSSGRFLEKPGPEYPLMEIQDLVFPRSVKSWEVKQLVEGGRKAADKM